MCRRDGGADHLDVAVGVEAEVAAAGIHRARVMHARALVGHNQLNPAGGQAAGAADIDRHGVRAGLTWGITDPVVAVVAR